MPRPDVTFLLPRLSGGGVERVFLNLAAGLAETGLSVEVVLARQGSTSPLLDIPEGVSCVDLAAPVTTDATFLLAVPALTRYLRARRPAVLYTGITTINLVGLAARALARVPTAVVISEHVPLSVNAGTHPLKRLLPWLARLAYPAADAIVAVSLALADDLAATAGLPRSRIVTVYNPVVTEQLVSGATEPPGHPWFDSDVPVILGVGRLEQQKDFVTLLRAFALLRTRREAKLLILGEGQQRGLLEDEVERLGLRGSVDLPGHVASPAPYLGHAAVFALSSTFEGFPTALIEALACGCRVVSTDCPTGPSEILEGGIHGTLVPVGDAQALADALALQLDTPCDRAALRQRGRQFSVAASTRHMVSLLAQVRALRAGA